MEKQLRRQKSATAKSEEDNISFVKEGESCKGTVVAQFTCVVPTGNATVNCDDFIVKPKPDSEVIRLLLKPYLKAKAKPLKNTEKNPKEEKTDVPEQTEEQRIRKEILNGPNYRSWKDWVELYRWEEWAEDETDLSNWLHWHQRVWSDVSEDDLRKQILQKMLEEEEEKIQEYLTEEEPVPTIIDQLIDNLTEEQLIALYDRYGFNPPIRIVFEPVTCGICGREGLGFDDVKSLTDIEVCLDCYKTSPLAVKCCKCGDEYHASNTYEIDGHIYCEPCIRKEVRESERFFSWKKWIYICLWDEETVKDWRSWHKKAWHKVPVQDARKRLLWKMMEEEQCLMEEAERNYIAWW